MEDLDINKLASERAIRSGAFLTKHILKAVKLHKFETVSQVTGFLESLLETFERGDL
jgi:hypothetical protein